MQSRMLTVSSSASNLCPHISPGRIRSAASSHFSGRVGGFAARRSSWHCKARRHCERVLIQANELNVWGNVDGRDEDAGEDDDSFDRDTAAVVLRVLTARATQRLLQQLAELDIHLCTWLSAYVSEHRPLDGNKFLLELYKQPAFTVKGLTKDSEHFVNPADLASRILTIRQDMAQKLSQFEEYVALDNTNLMRAHLETSSYFSGSHTKNEPGSPDR